MTKFFLSCEHGGNRIPEKYQHLFVENSHLLETHRGWDIGALELFRAMNQFPIHFSIDNEVSRLLIDFNRSLHKRSLFSAFTKGLPAQEKQIIINEYYLPFRRGFAEKMVEVISAHQEVFHVSVHSFTPILNGEVRNADIGILFNPSHGREKEIALQWKSILKDIFPQLKVRFNYPYLGKTDGHVAPLRQQFGKAYAGIELELNNKHAGCIEVLNAIVLSYSNLISIL